MTLNIVIALILRFSLNSIDLLAKCVTVVKYRLIMSVNIVSQFQSSTYGHNLPTLQRGLSAIAKLLVSFYDTLGKIQIINYRCKQLT